MVEGWVGVVGVVGVAPFVTLLRRVSRLSGQYYTRPCTPPSLADHAPPPGFAPSTASSLAVDRVQTILTHWRAERGGMDELLETGDNATLLKALVPARLLSHPPALLAVIWHHLPPPFVPLYHPTLPSATPIALRFLLSSTSALGGMFAMVCFYVALLGSKAPAGRLELPGLSTAAFVSLDYALAVLINSPWMPYSFSCKGGWGLPPLGPATLT